MPFLKNLYIRTFFSFFAITIFAVKNISAAEPQKLYASVASIGSTRLTNNLLLKLLEETLASQKDKSFAAQKWENFVATCSDKLIVKRFN